MILSDTAILEAMEFGAIVIEPFDPACLGGNSYDVHLGSTLLVYAPTQQVWHGNQLLPLLDAKEANPTMELPIPDEGIVLFPGQLYLGSTVEYTEAHQHVPNLDGKSSIGRLGISIHATAGRGDVGFCNHWTLEIIVPRPVKVYAGMPIGQLTYHTVEGQVAAVYSRKAGAKYTTRNPKPQASAMWLNFEKKP